jgi:kynurenine formamidase
VWSGFGQATMSAACDTKTLRPFTIERDGFRTTFYSLVGQYGTHVDPPAHFRSDGLTMDEIPLKQMILPLVVFDITPMLARDPNRALTIDDIKAWEKEHGKVPAGAFAALRTDMSKEWTANPERFKRSPFPAWSLAAIKFLFEDRKVTAIGHESLDTDTTETMDSETWILKQNHYQIEAMTNLDKGAPRRRRHRRHLAQGGARRRLPGPGVRDPAVVAVRSPNVRKTSASDVVKVDEVNIFASPMPRDLQQIADTGEAAFAGEARRDLFDGDRRDGVDFDLAAFEMISLAHANVGTHPHANASRDRTASNAVAQVFREQHRTSLASADPSERRRLAGWTAAGSAARICVIRGRSPRPSHRLGETRQRRRQLLDVRTGEAIQLPSQHAADCRLLLIGAILQHIDVMPRQPHAQLRASDRLRQDAVRIIPKRLFDHVQRPDFQRLGRHLRPRKPLPHRRRPQFDLPRLNGLGHPLPRPPEERRRLRNADMRPWV